MNAKTVEFEPFDDIGGGCTFEIPLADAIIQLTKAMEKIPPEHRASAVLHIGGGDESSVYPEVRYTRPETEDEQRAKKQWHERRQADYAAGEKREYLRLKAKFEKPLDGADR